MASLSDVDRALAGVVERLRDVDPQLRARHVLERTVSCTVPDLQVTYRARLTDQGLCDVTTGAGGRAQVRLEVCSDDLVALTEGRLGVPTAWASGRLKVDANVLDLLKLRALL